jgi:hypothetical protein
MDGILEFLANIAKKSQQPVSPPPALGAAPLPQEEDPIRASFSRLFGAKAKMSPSASPDITGMSPDEIAMAHRPQAPNFKQDIQLPDRNREFWESQVDGSPALLREGQRQAAMTPEERVARWKQPTPATNSDQLMRDLQAKIDQERQMARARLSTGR